MVKNLRIFLILSLLFPASSYASQSSNNSIIDHAQAQPKDRRWKTPPSYLVSGLKIFGYATGAALLMNYAFDKSTGITAGVNLQQLCAAFIKKCVFPDLTNPQNPHQVQQLDKSISYIGTAHLITTLAAGSAAALWATRNDSFERTMHARKKTFNQVYKEDPYGAITSNREHAQYWQEIPSLEKIEVELREPTVAKRTALYSLAGALGATVPSRIAGQTVIANSSLDAGSLSTIILAGSLVGTAAGACLGYNKSFSKKTVAQIITDDDEKAAKALIKQHHYIFDVHDAQGKYITELVDKESKVGCALGKKLLRDAKKCKDTREVASLMRSYSQLSKKIDKQVAADKKYLQRKPYTTAGGTVFYSKYDQRQAVATIH